MKIDIERVEEIERKIDKKVEEDRIIIYFIGVKSSGKYKIGRTKRDVYERLKELKEINPKYELIDSYECNHISGEKIIHNYLSLNNVKRVREFFYYEDMEELRLIVKTVTEILNDRIKNGKYLKGGVYI